MLQLKSNSLIALCTLKSRCGLHLLCTSIGHSVGNVHDRSSADFAYADDNGREEPCRSRQLLAPCLPGALAASIMSAKVGLHTDVLRMRVVSMRASSAFAT